MKKITISLLSLIAISTLASASNYDEYLNYDVQKENAKPLNYSQLDRTNMYDVSNSHAIHFTEYADVHDISNSKTMHFTEYADVHDISKSKTIYYKK